VREVKIQGGAGPLGGESVLRLGETDVSEVVDVLCEAFADYPVMRFVLGPRRGRYSEHLRRLMHFFVMARVYRREFLLGVADRGTLQGAALVSRPSGSVSPPELGALREELWSELGSEARARYEAFGAALAGVSVPVPHIHLNLIGVRRAAHGKGHGRKLLEHVHALSRDDPASSGVTLNTEDEANVPLYERFDYKLVGHVEVTPGLTSWVFFRPDSG
jgi:GNAT superfamily N-acetyltransferase